MRLSPLFLATSLIFSHYAVATESPAPAQGATMNSQQQAENILQTESIALSGAGIQSL